MNKDEIKLKLLLNLLTEFSERYDEILKLNEELIKKLEEEAKIDYLTGLPNRKALHEELTKQINRIKRKKGETLCLGILDLDNFKLINDTFGHIEGDKVLREVARIIKSHLRNYDIFGRWGGDEFIIGVVDCEFVRDPSKCKKCPIYHRIVQDIAKIGKRYGVDLGASFGTVKIPIEAEDIETAIKIADRRLYTAKRLGKHRIVNDFIEKELIEKGILKKEES
jgi:diguanylate cyclase (GGDEF)-like protein